MSMIIGPGITLGAGISFITTLPYVGNSLAFNGADTYLVADGNLADWAIAPDSAAEWTIEFWIKAASASTGTIYGIMGQNVFTDQTIDLYLQEGTLKIGNANYTEPPPGVWTHVAIVRASSNSTVYYNGTAQSPSKSGPFNSYWSNDSIALTIGRRGNNDFQYFNGLLADIRINNTALYTSTFDPYTVARPPGPVAGTVLLLNTTPTSAIADTSTHAHTITVTNVTKSADYPA